MGPDPRPRHPYGHICAATKLDGYNTKAEANARPSDKSVEAPGCPSVAHDMVLPRYLEAMLMLWNWLGMPNEILDLIALSRGREQGQGPNYILNVQDFCSMRLVS